MYLFICATSFHLLDFGDGGRRRYKYDHPTSYNVTDGREKHQGQLAMTQEAMTEKTKRFKQWVKCLDDLPDAHHDRITQIGTELAWGVSSGYWGVQIGRSMMGHWHFQDVVESNNRISDYVETRWGKSASEVGEADYIIESLFMAGFLEEKASNQGTKLAIISDRSFDLLKKPTRRDKLNSYAPIANLIIQTLILLALIAPAIFAAIELGKR